MRPLLGLSVLAFLVTACGGAAQFPSTASAGPTSATSTAVASMAPSSEASPSPPAAASAVPPPAPSDVTWSQTPALGFGAGTTTMTVTWKEALTVGVTVRVYGVTRCLNPPGTDNVPCVVATTKLPDNALTLVATAPAAQGSLSWTWPSWGNIGQALAVHGKDSYYAVVLGAYSAAGHSKMIIVATAGACSTCTT